jgi:hypothetical protein
VWPRDPRHVVSTNAESGKAGEASLVESCCAVPSGEALASEVPPWTGQIVVRCSIARIVPVRFAPPHYATNNQEPHTHSRCRGHPAW